MGISFRLGDSSLHAGIVRFLLGLVPVVLLVGWLQKVERKIPARICLDELIEA
jgi:hypothetical protein